MPLIILNGTSSSGKSSVAKSIQKIMNAPVLHASIDDFRCMLDWDFVQDKERQKCFDLTARIFYESLAVMASDGFLVIADTVYGKHEWYERSLEILKEYLFIVVGVRCPLEVAEERERNRGDRVIGLARHQFDRVHQRKQYDLEVDTSELSGDECAELILEALNRKIANNDLQDNLHRSRSGGA